MRVLVVDDEPALRESLRRALSLEGYEVHLADGGLDGLRQVIDAVPDAILLDVLMPDLDGLELCRMLRGRGDRTPVLMLTARERVADRVAGLDAGADDYLVKPFDLDELLARLRALLRRSVAADEQSRLRYGPLLLDQDSRSVRIGDRNIELTRTEFALLEVLMLHAGKVLTRGTIQQRVWGYDFGPSSNSLGVYIGYLRRKLEAGGESRLVHTVRGLGYVLRGA
jgi:two-component system response regulator MprA